VPAGAALRRLGDQAQRGRPALGPLGQLPRLLLAHRKAKAPGEERPGLVGAKRQGGAVEHEALALDEQARQGAQRRARARGDDEAQARGRVGQPAIYQSMGGRGRVENVEIVEDEDGLGRELLEGAPHRGGQDGVAGARGQDVERALTDAGRDPPQAHYDARGEEVGIRVALVEGEPGHRPAGRGEGGHQQVCLAVSGLGGHDDEPPRAAVAQRLDQARPIDDPPSRRRRRQLGLGKGERLSHRGHGASFDPDHFRPRGLRGTALAGVHRDETQPQPRRLDSERRGDT
jgi:hypothetical protein